MPLSFDNNEKIQSTKDTESDRSHSKVESKELGPLLTFRHSKLTLGSRWAAALSSCWHLFLPSKRLVHIHCYIDLLSLANYQQLVWWWYQQSASNPINLTIKVEGYNALTGSNGGRWCRAPINISMITRQFGTIDHYVLFSLCVIQWNQACVTKLHHAKTTLHPGSSLLLIHNSFTLSAYVSFSTSNHDFFCYFSTWSGIISFLLYITLIAHAVKALSSKYLGGSLFGNMWIIANTCTGLSLVFHCCLTFIVVNTSWWSLDS